MSVGDRDLTPLVQAAAEAWFDITRGVPGVAFADLPPMVQHTFREHVLPIVVAVVKVADDDRAEVWDEGYGACSEDVMAQMWGERDDRTPNPYRGGAS